jgi:hypothetical protein
MRILGVDCARVIFNPIVGSVPDAVQSLHAVTQSGRFEKIYIVSQVNPVGRFIFSHRLRLRNIWNYTGIPESNLYFCRYRHEKSAICEKLGITDFIDDNLEVLSYMQNVGRLYAFNPKKKNIGKYQLPEHVVFFSSWKELMPRLLSSER